MQREHKGHQRLLIRSPRRGLFNEFVSAVQGLQGQGHALPLRDAALFPGCLLLQRSPGAREVLLFFQHPPLFQPAQRDQVPPARAVRRFRQPRVDPVLKGFRSAAPDLLLQDLTDQFLRLLFRPSGVLSLRRASREKEQDQRKRQDSHLDSSHSLHLRLSAPPRGSIVPGFLRFCNPARPVRFLARALRFLPCFFRSECL